MSIEYQEGGWPYIFSQILNHVGDCDQIPPTDRTTTARDLADIAAKYVS